MYKTTIEEVFELKMSQFFFFPVSEKDHHGCHLQYSLKDQKIHTGHVDIVMPKIYCETALCSLQREVKRTMN